MVVCLDLDAVLNASEVETNPLIRFAAIVHGSARYPELRVLIPTPPEGTRLCGECGGTGDGPNNAGQSCSACSEFGWRGAPSALAGQSTTPSGETGRPDETDTVGPDEPGSVSTMAAGPDQGAMRVMSEPELYSPRQLPELSPDAGDGDLRFEWDQDGDDNVVRHGGVTLWRERTGREVSRRFAEIADVLRAKYGEKLKDLVPTPAGLRALLDNNKEAAERVAVVRAALGSPPETERYDVHSLTFAVRNGQRETIRRFLAQDDERGTRELGLRTTLLHAGVERREEDIVWMLLCAGGAALGDVDSRGWSPLADALDEPSRTRGSVPLPRQEAALTIVRLLLEAGARVDGPGEADTRTLAVAARNGNVAALHFLLERGADPDGADFCGVTALHRAASAGFVETARLLCEAGADPNTAYEPPRWTPLHSAIWSSDAREKGTTAPLIRLLVRSGADIDKGEREGNSPLFAAISEARDDMISLLLDLGANVRHRNHAGDGAAAFLVRRMRMRMLSEEQMLPILQTLLRAGADPGTSVEGGSSAYDLAREYDYWDIAALLKAR